MAARVGSLLTSCTSSTAPQEMAAANVSSAKARARADRSMPGGGEQLRVNVGYAATLGFPYHGTMLVATRSEPPAGLVVVLGGDLLTAGTIDGVLDSARWH